MGTTTYKERNENGDNRHSAGKVISVFYLRLKAKGNYTQQPSEWKISETKFNERRQNQDSNNKNGIQNYKQSKNVQ